MNGEELQRRRLNRGFAVEWFAEKIGTTPTRLRLLEAGVEKPTDDERERIREAFTEKPLERRSGGGKKDRKPIDDELLKKIEKMTDEGVGPWTIAKTLGLAKSTVQYRVKKYLEEKGQKKSAVVKVRKGKEMDMEGQDGRNNDVKVENFLVVDMDMKLKEQEQINRDLEIENMKLKAKIGELAMVLGRI